ncbi:Uncharacterized protein SCF082_LOCUS47836 [Durusdinium trenchii]|uniref:ASCH domain-containing protein n=1 Tax=Durusdinium trenchii TaxID=1381693 RepID=A0ABP0RRW1_9DINO
MAESDAPMHGAQEIQPSSDNECRPPLRRLCPLSIPTECETPETAIEDTSCKHPAIGDRVMVIKGPGLIDILTGAKTMEVRRRWCKPGFVWLAQEGRVHGSATIEGGLLTEEEFHAKASEHQMPLVDGLPFQKNFGITFAHVMKLPVPLEYWRPPANTQWNIYRTGPADAPRSNTKTPRKKRAANPQHSKQSPVSNSEPPKACKKQALLPQMLCAMPNLEGRADTINPSPDGTTPAEQTEP